MLYNHHKNYIFSVLTVLSLTFLLILSAYAGNINRAYRLNEDGLSALNKGNYELAIRHLKSAFKEAPNNTTIMRNLATAYNNYGLALAKEENLDKAIECLQLALSLQPATLLYRENLSAFITQKAYKYYQDRESEKAEKLLKEALEYNPNNFNALDLVGDICYYNQYMREAKSYWERALNLKPELESIEKKLFKLNKEYAVESQLKELDSFNFEIRYVQEEPQYEDKAYRVREYLLDAYREVGIDFNYYPKYKIIVLIYSEEDFRNLKDKSPSGTAAGIYDGKIRLPAKRALTEEELKKLIFHEYTHLVVNDLSGSNCPIWFNEGLAKYEESKVGKVEFLYLNPVRNNRLPQENKISNGVKDKIIPLNLLSDAFQSPNEKDILLAYEESFSLVNYIIHRFNFYTVTRILEKLKQEQFEDILQKELYLNLTELEERWKEENDYTDF